MAPRYSCIIYPDRDVSHTARLLGNLASLDPPPAQTVFIPRPGIFPERAALVWALPQVSEEFTGILDSDMLLDPKAPGAMLSKFAEGVGCVAGVLRDPCVGRFGYFKLWRTALLREITFSARTIRDISPDTDYAARCEDLGWIFLRLAEYVGDHSPSLDPYVIFNIFFRVGVKQRARGRLGTAAQLWGVEEAMKLGTPWSHLALFAFHYGIRVDYVGDPHNEQWHEFSSREYLKSRSFCERLVERQAMPGVLAYPKQPHKLLLVSCCLMTGGVERTMVDLATHLDPERFEVITAYEHGADREMLDALDAAGRRHIEVGSAWDALLDEVKPDLLITFLRTGVYEAAGARGIPMIERTPGWNGHSRVPSDLFERILVEYPSFKRELLGKPELRAQEDQIRLLYNAINLDRFRPMDKKEARKKCGLRDHALLIGSVARIHPVKNLGMQVRALGALVSVGMDAELHILGRTSDPEERSRLEQLGDSLGIKPRLFFHGVIPDPAPFLAAVDVVALSSLTEGAPNALIEAMAMRRPIVATDVGGVREVTDGLAMYIAVDDDAAFVEGLIRMSQKQWVDYPSIARHEMSLCMRRWEQVCEEVIQNRKPSKTRMIIGDTTDPRVGRAPIHRPAAGGTS